MVPLGCFFHKAPTPACLGEPAALLGGVVLPALTLTNFDQESETIVSTKPQWPGPQHQKVKPSREPLTTVTCSINKRLTKNQRPIHYPSPTGLTTYLGCGSQRQKEYRWFQRLEREGLNSPGPMKTSQDFNNCMILASGNTFLVLLMAMILLFSLFHGLN